MSNKQIKVKNRHGTADNLPSSCSSWKEFWEKVTKRKFSNCANSKCSASATDGAHVIKVDSVDKKTYIVSLCHECNTQFNKDFFEVDEENLVYASEEIIE